MIVLAAVADAGGSIVTNAWRPVFKGIEHMAATNYPDAAVPRRQVAHCLRVDLADPDIRFLATPPAPAPVPGSRETLSLTITNFLLRNGVQAAVNANFYSPGDPPGEGNPEDVYGLQISRGVVVSAQETGGSGCNCVLFFTTNNDPGILWSNIPPTNTLGFYTAVTGFYPIVSNGLNIGAAAVTNYPDAQDNGDVHLPKQPRTVLGLSADRRYLYVMVIDGGPQPGYSEGALDVEAANWMLVFGGWDAVSMDGGHSTALYCADPFGNPVAYNHSNALVDYGHERYIGSHLGIYAVPFLTGLSVTPDFFQASVGFSTVTNATTSVAYGVSANYGAVTPPDTTPAMGRTATLAGLQPDTTYYYQVTATVGTNQYSAASSFHTRRFADSLAAAAGPWTATITWTTLSNATSQVDYGFDASYGNTTPLDPRLTNTHTVRLTGLLAGTLYYYRVTSLAGTNCFTASSTFTTSISFLPIFDITNAWKYTCVDLDGINWQAATFIDDGWSGPGAGLLWVDTRAGGPFSGVQPKNTQIPDNPATGYPYPTCYFRTHFGFAGPSPGVSLLLSNYVDDGAIFYLNGAEIYRLRMNPPPTTFNTTAAGYPCSGLPSSDPCHGNACPICPDVFTVSGGLLTNLVAGDNVLAVEVHNYSLASPDITFGMALSYAQTLPPATPPGITIQPADQVLSGGGSATFYVLAEGDLPLSFQWRFNGVPILSATNNLLTLTNAQANNLGSYDVLVSNPSGTVVSQPAVLQAPGVPRITLVNVQGTQLAVSISSQPGLSYVLEYTPDLAGGAWTPVSTNAASDSVLNLVSPLMPGPNGFLRVRVQ
jgi:hypothetical protein